LEVLIRVDWLWSRRRQAVPGSHQRMDGNVWNKQEGARCYGYSTRLFFKLRRERRAIVYYIDSMYVLLLLFGQDTTHHRKKPKRTFSRAQTRTSWRCIFSHFSQSTPPRSARQSFGQRMM
jgi:hypothetical protein